MRLLRLKQTLDRTGDTRSPLYDKALRGLFTTAIKLGGARASAWPEHEVDAIVAARIRGDNDEAIRALVARLHDARKTVGIDEGALPSRADATSVNKRRGAPSGVAAAR